ncbi:MAG: hypothetical protein V1728_03745 [Candidatus Micrarchaeota archaeon]
MNFKTIAKKTTLSVVAIAVCAWFTFSPLHEARAQEKADSTKNKPAISLLQPINFASYNRQSPNMWLFSGTSQAMYFYKQNPLDASERTSIYALGVASSDWQAGLHRMVKSTSSTRTTTDGAAFRYLLPFGSGSLVCATRLGISRTEGKSGIQTAPLVDMVATWAQPEGVPMFLTVGAGSSEDFIALSAGTQDWITSSLYRHNGSAGASMAIGADYSWTYSKNLGQRFYASIEQWENSNKKDIIAGSRLFFPFGTLELNYEHIIALPAADKQNISIRMTYCLR